MIRKTSSLGSMFFTEKNQVQHCSSCGDVEKVVPQDSVFHKKQSYGQFVQDNQYKSHALRRFVIQRHYRSMTL
jgi:hypothetical protein